MPSGDVIQSVLAPAGSQSSVIYHLWTVMLWVLTAVLAATIAFVTAALVRGMRSGQHPSSSQRTLSRGVAIARAAAHQALQFVMTGEITNMKAFACRAGL